MPSRRPGKLSRRNTRPSPQPRNDKPPEPEPPTPGDGLLAKLTPRETEVLALYLELLNDKKVANCLGTRVQTVRNQLASIEHKLGARSREELVALRLSLNHP